LKKAMRTWGAFRKLDPGDRGLAIEMAAALMATRVGLRLAGMRRWKAVLLRLTPRKAWTAPEPAGMAVAQKIARIQGAVSRHLTWHPSCLEQSLVLWWQLRRRGIAAQMRIGARKEAGRFEAHAWVELGKVILNDSGEAHTHFVPFDGSILSQET
jgi:Transglutaminase-like superfamily